MENLKQFCIAQGYSAMKAGQAIKALTVKIRANDVVMEKCAYIAAHFHQGAKVETKEVDKIQPMSRMAYFRADQHTQDAHEKKIRESGKKTEYRLMRADDCFTVIGAFEFAYFNFLKG